MQFGIIGFPLTHSFSPAYFSAKFASEEIDASYTAFPLHSIDQLPALIIEHPGLRGFNVTIPYKTAIIPYLDILTTEAEKIGAVNCVHIKDGRLIGYNTDYAAFSRSLAPLLNESHRQALVLGTGGAAQAVHYALRQAGIAVLNVSRTRYGPSVITYEMLTEKIISDHTIIVNTSPLGMYPDTGSCPPIPYPYLSSGHILYDLVYNPGETLFLQLGKQYGCTVKNGLEMLILQAEASWNIWSRG